MSEPNYVAEDIQSARGLLIGMLAGLALIALVVFALIACT